MTHAQKKKFTILPTLTKAEICESRKSMPELGKDVIKLSCFVVDTLDQSKLDLFSSPNIFKSNLIIVRLVALPVHI